MIITLNFNPKESVLIDDLKEIAGSTPLSRFTKGIIFDYISKYQTNPVLLDRSERVQKIEAALIILNDSEFWTRTIQDLDPKNLRILETCLQSLTSKVSKKLQYGTVNVR